MSYPATAPTTTPLSPAVAQLATVRGMGRWLRTYPARRLEWWRVLILGIFVVGLLGGAVAFLFAGAWLGVALFVAFALPFLWVASRAPNFNPIRAARQVYLFEQGFIQADRTSAVDYRFDQIEWVTQAITHVYRYGIKVQSIYLYTIRRADGQTTKVTQFYKDIAELGNAIAEQVTAVHLPRAIDAIRAGRTINFGDLSVNLSGIAAAGKGALPWTEIQKVTVNNGVISVAKQGKWLAWSAKQAKDIPNLFVFLELANRLAAAGR